MLNALRLTSGVPASLFAERTGLPISVAAHPIAEAARKGLLDPDPTMTCRRCFSLYPGTSPRRGLPCPGSACRSMSGTRRRSTSDDAFPTRPRAGSDARGVRRGAGRGPCVD
jgi:hypothetical protein